MKKKLIAILTFALSSTFCAMVMWAGAFDEYNITKVSAGAYDMPTIVIDPGHGGYDGGAEAKDGTKEKDLNLQISMELKKIMEQYPVKVVMTRSEDVALLQEGNKSEKASKKRQDLLARKKIIEESTPVLTVSIHLNSYKANEYVYGAQVFYPNGNREGTKARKYEQESERYAKNVQNAIEMRIADGRNRSAMPKNDILIFEEITSPIILVECGFLSNNEEAEKLKRAEFQKELAMAVWEGINENLCLEKRKKIEMVVGENKFKKS